MIACLIAVATASAAAVVYSNDFSSGREMRELKPRTKKGCDRGYDKKRNAARVRVNGRGLCAYAPPVQSDGDRADLVVRLQGRVSKATPDALQKDTYLAVGARGGYVLEVYPKGKRFRLIRRPEAGEFPVSGKEKRINRIGDRNELSLQAFGNDIVAKVNGKTVARVADPAPEQVKGRGVVVGAGLARKGKRPVGATMTSVKVAVPNP